MNLPDTYLDDETVDLLHQAGALILKGKEKKAHPSELRLILVDLQVLRFEIGNRMSRAKGHSRDVFREEYNINRNKKMSPNAAYKEAEWAERVVKWKNTRDMLETAYDTIQNFVNTNQTSLGIAKEEAKNNL